MSALSTEQLSNWSGKLAFDDTSIHTFNEKINNWDKEQQSKAQNSDSKYRQMALTGFDT